MVSSKETTPAAYLASLDPERRKVIAAIRTRITKHLTKGFVESMNWGMLCYEVPLSRYPETYNKQPLMFAGLAAQKNNYALYLTNLPDPDAAHARLAAAYKAAGRKFDMGKSCLRFKSMDELPLDVIDGIIAGTTVDGVIERYESSRRLSAAASTTTKRPAKKAASKTATVAKAAKTAKTAKSAKTAKKVATRASKKT